MCLKSRYARYVLGIVLGVNFFGNKKGLKKLS
ncbi:hypothetical protein PITCH_A1920095 [uncultured Desulfobacterium sp.]|uniref:Uncharacterized protein n=1 Tax=uncultured Desulfobacterium sp. TaxID=201089 RepID=A0A445MW97_9BACT|nr:hypothetical protein PITCH_A1920095 [uncultured Desulfobacterium sp.]